MKTYTAEDAKKELELKKAKKRGRKKKEDVLAWHRIYIKENTKYNPAEFYIDVQAKGETNAIRIAQYQFNTVNKEGGFGNRITITKTKLLNLDKGDKLLGDKS
jgi:hypothetical protein